MKVTDPLSFSSTVGAAGRRTVRTYSSRWRQVQSSCVFCGGDCSLCAGSSYLNDSDHNPAPTLTTTAPTTFNQNKSEHNHSDYNDYYHYNHHHNGSDNNYDHYYNYYYDYDHHNHHNNHNYIYNVFHSHATLAQSRPDLLLLLFALLAL